MSVEEEIPNIDRESRNSIKILIPKKGEIISYFVKGSVMVKISDLITHHWQLLANNFLVRF